VWSSVVRTKTYTKSVWRGSETKQTTLTDQRRQEEADDGGGMDDDVWKILDFSQIGDTGYISVVRNIAKFKEIQDLAGRVLSHSPTELIGIVVPELRHIQRNKQQYGLSRT
jgi:hypothetical protein